MYKLGEKTRPVPRNLSKIIFFSCVLLFTVVTSVVRRLDVDALATPLIRFSPFIIEITILLMVIGNSFSSYFVVFDNLSELMVWEFPCYLLWGIITLSAILAMKNKRGWKYVVYALLAVDVFFNMNRLAIFVDAVMLCSFYMTLKQTAKEGTKKTSSL